MQNDAFKRFSKDLTDALVIPVNYLNKKAKRIPLPGNEKKNRVGAVGLAGLQVGVLKNYDDHHHQPSPGGLHYNKTHHRGSESVSLHNFSLSTISKTSVDDNQSFTSNGSGSTTSFGKFGKSSLKSPLSPTAFRGSGGLPVREEPPLVHCPPSVASPEQFSPERLAWVKDCIYQPAYSQPQHGNALKASGHAWDTIEGANHDGGHFHNGHSGTRSIDEISPTHNYPGHCFGRSGYNNPNEATGLLFVKLMQVTNKATTKLFDVEWSLRVGNIERTSHPTRSFKDNPGNTATMNEVFLL
ncbi:hypothetical protein BG000_006046 [Podila horticola]|nr:hypothetical protein BG000_006046 [Podila horticola]